MTENNIKCAKYEAPKKLAIINDLSGYGRCSLTVAIPVISALGVQACPVPTSILSNHTGFPSEYKYDFTKQMRPYMDAWNQLNIKFDGIITGYMNYDEQVRAAADFIEKFKTKDTLVFVDPAMADHGRMYRGFTEEYAEYIKDRLIRQATIIKPNLTEACILSGYSYDEIVRASEERNLRKLKSYLMNIIATLQELGPDKVVITGIERKDRIINAIADGNDVKFLSVKKSGQNRGGTGDIFCSIVAASLLQGMSLDRAVKKAADFVSTAIRISDEAEIPVREGVIFENIMSKLASTSYENAK
ncbi:MAG: pyridoxamine kinase [Eubacteriales bacterium]|nr:pyridoxamine kinase [Eubacteriales bacterium]